jgi:hypothetical protein
VLVLLYLLYLSLFHAGQIFTNFQWDYLLLETGFLAIFLPGALGSRSGFSGGSCFDCAYRLTIPKERAKTGNWWRREYDCATSVLAELIVDGYVVSP